MCRLNALGSAEPFNAPFTGTIALPPCRPSSTRLYHPYPCSFDWLQVWCCLQRAMQGPWTMDVRHLSRHAAPNGVLLVFEVLLQHLPPSACDPAASAQLPAATVAASSGAAGSAAAAYGGVAAAAAPGAMIGGAGGYGAAAAAASVAPVVVQQHAWKDHVTLLSFGLDGRRVEVVVDTSGRCVVMCRQGNRPGMRGRGKGVA